MITALVLAFVLISVIAIAIAVVDTVRFVRRTGNPMPTAMAFRSYGA